VMDKPIATTQADAVAIVEAVDRSGILAIVNFSQRFGWLGQRMKTLVDTGALGEVISFWSHSLLPDPSHESWRHDPRFACGFTIESLCHNIDQMRWLAGPITAVGGRVAQTLAELPACDNTMAAPWRRWSLCKAGERACSTPVGLRHFAAMSTASGSGGHRRPRSATDRQRWRSRSRSCVRPNRGKSSRWIPSLSGREGHAAGVRSPRSALAPTLRADTSMRFVTRTALAPYAWLDGFTFVPGGE
jgi:GFO/IDH/MocA C-terminal domain